MEVPAGCRRSVYHRVSLRAFLILFQLIHDTDGATARLYIRPGDRMSKPLLSTNVSTNNVLLKITVPKRTGLKRRKGSQGPFHEGLEKTIDSAPVTKQPKLVCMTKDTRYLIRSMRDNPKTYQVQAAGTIERTHRFRGNSMTRRRTNYPNANTHEGCRTLLFRLPICLS